MIKPTQELYADLQTAYDFFNQELFDSILPDCLITVQREKQVQGYFSSKKFESTKDKSRVTDEIAMNPAYFSIFPLEENLSTLVHEMCHLWQHHFGQPGRGKYHNKEWANKMEAIGLCPSDTGKPGGAKTGDKMNNYVAPGGKFQHALKKLLDEHNEFDISWHDRVKQISVSMLNHIGGSQAMESPGEETETISFSPDVEIVPNKSNRQKYSCPDCGLNAWAKPGVLLMCGECRKDME